MRNTIIAAMLGAILLSAWTLGAVAPVRVMILDGESAGAYHDWQRVTPVLKKMLDETGLFDTTVVVNRPVSSSIFFRTGVTRCQS